MRYTIVVEWPEGQEPSVSYADEFNGGKVCAVQFSDALAELQALYAENPGLQEPISMTPNAEAQRTERSDVPLERVVGQEKP